MLGPAMDDARTMEGWAGPDRDAPGRAQSAAGEESFRQLYAATFRPLWGYLQHASGRADVADDLAQETYCKYLERQTPRMDEAQTRSYLFRIATNLLHNRCRSRDDAAMEEPAGAGAAPNEETRLDVRAAMSRLSTRERQLLWLAYVEGMSHAEIAAVTGLRATSIRILLYRARQRASGMLRPPRTGR